MSKTHYLGNSEAREQTDGQEEVASSHRQGPGYTEVGVCLTRLVLSWVLDPASPELGKG